MTPTSRVGSERIESLVMETFPDCGPSIAVAKVGRSSRRVVCLVTGSLIRICVRLGTMKAREGMIYGATELEYLEAIGR